MTKEQVKQLLTMGFSIDEILELSDTAPSGSETAPTGSEVAPTGSEIAPIGSETATPASPESILDEFRRLMGGMQEALTGIQAANIRGSEQPPQSEQSAYDILGTIINPK